jgi:hypothetical protein
MRPLELDEIVDLDSYEVVRAGFRERVIAHKRARRVAVGDRVTLLFEDRETLRFQVQEMLRVERIRDPQKVQAELDVYNPLIPGGDELSATLFVEITDASEIRPELDRLVGIDEHVSLIFGEDAGESAVRARFDPRQYEEDRISAVQYLRFPILPADAARLSDPATPVRLRIDHPQYRHEVELGPATRASLLADLRGEPAALLAPAPGARPRRVWVDTDRVRAEDALEPRARVHVVVEAKRPSGSLLDADPSLVAELIDAARQVAAEVVTSGRRARIATDVDADGASTGLRWHVWSVDA